MRYFWKGVIHFLTSNSRHGTHSPFVYKLADEAIYAKSKKHAVGSKQDELLMDVADYFEVTYVQSNLDLGADRALIVEKSTMNVEELAVLVREFKYLVIPNIYKDRTIRQTWHLVCQDPRFIVCIDLFYYGLVFYRREQPKEFFKLRFPYWR
ncbi:MULTISPECIES: hypothetical protein [Sphingobacterium]|uniref:hypothetical protein n=1 Tax=Sphingobacterium TaxID=28453 RepID=UPI0013DBE279|nr:MULTISPECIES: hypothetical protein [unclassified Sphingobacterium]